MEKILADVKQQYSQNTKYSFTNSQYLALCLYILEKDCFVPGNDTSSNKQKAKQQSLEEQNIVEKSDNNTSITKDNNNLSIEDDDIDCNNIDDEE